MSNSNRVYHPLEGSFFQAEQRFRDLENKIDSLQSTLHLLQGNSADVDTHSKRIGDLEACVVDISNTNNQFARDKEELEGRISTVEKELSFLKNELSDLKSKESKKTNPVEQYFKTIIDSHAKQLDDLRYLSHARINTLPPQNHKVPYSWIGVMSLGWLIGATATGLIFVIFLNTL